MKLVKITTNHDLAIKGRTYVAIKNKDNSYTLTHTLMNDRLVQLINSIVITDDFFIVIDNKAPSLSFNTKSTGARSRAPYNPYNTRRDVYKGDCVDCKEQAMYCGALHNV